MTTWITDEHDNRCAVEYFGSEKAAQAALASLHNCQNCENCSGCSGCSYCSRCSDCSYCSGCSRCSGCSYCSRCSDCSRCSYCSRCSDCSRCSGCSGCSDCNENCIVGSTRSDGYTFFLDEQKHVRAGCRDFATFAEAREHWKNTRGGTKLGVESLHILNALEEIVALQKA